MLKLPLMSLVFYQFIGGSFSALLVFVLISLSLTAASR